MAAVTDLCDAVTNAINTAALAGTLGIPVTAERVHDLELQLEQQGGPKIYVFAGDIQGLPADRNGNDTEDMIITVALSAKLQTEGRSERDELANVVQKVWTAVRGGIAPATYRFVSRSTDVEAEQANRQGRKHFLRITDFTYRVIRSA